MSLNILIFVLNARQLIELVQVKIMFIYEGTNNLVSGAFLKCFSIHCCDWYLAEICPHADNVSLL